MKSYLWSSLVTVFITGSMAFSTPQIERDEYDAGEDALAIKVYEVNVNIPFGKSVWTDILPVPTGSSPLHISYIKNSSCPASSYFDVDVRIAASGVWETTKYQGGYDYYSGGPIDGIRFNFNETRYHNMVCNWRVSAAQGPVANPPPPLLPEKFAGVVSYLGGFKKDLEIVLPAPLEVTQFRIDVPKFCKDVQVLEAFTVTEGISDKATLVNPTGNLFSVNKGQGMRISKILFSVNGPVGLTCDVPIFIVTK